jgi:hypothetical protein
MTQPPPWKYTIRPLGFADGTYSRTGRSKPPEEGMVKLSSRSTDGASPKSRAMSMGPLRASCGVLCQKGLRLADLTISSRVSISLSIGSCLLSVCGRAAAH